MPLIGTAGHVDHGKSTLIHRLSGRDPDRWKEEKARGLTIDLGFAWTRLPSGSEVSFVDVPGHERYMKNMLAGIEAIDVALLVVAADESWMPQTEEHVAVLDLLEVQRGVVALTKTDAVDPELVELATLDVSERLAGTSLEHAPIVPVSAVTGEGIESLIEELDAQVDNLTGEPGRPRLWVDRSFPISGAGTVVTGSLLGGNLEVDQRVEIFPRSVEARIRGIQSHESGHRSIEPGRRVALNLSGVEHSEIQRGDMVGEPGQWDTTTRFSAHIRPARYVDDITPRGAYTIHIGSTSQPIQITGMSANSVMMQLKNPIATTAGDRFIIRDTGRKLVIAGGRVVDIAPGATKGALTLADSLSGESTADQVASALLGSRKIDDLDRLQRHTAGGSPSEAVIAEGVAIADTYAEELAARARDEVVASHERHPLRPGLPLATLTATLGVQPNVVEMIVQRAGLVRTGPDVAAPDFAPALDSVQNDKWSSAKRQLGSGLAVDSDVDLGLDEELLAHLIRTGELIRVSTELVYLPEQVDQLKDHAFQLGDGFTVADFRDATGLSRKYAVPILEWMDKEGLTVRRGDTRSFR